MLPILFGNTPGLRLAIRDYRLTVFLRNTVVKVNHELFQCYEIPGFQELLSLCYTTLVIGVVFTCECDIHGVGAGAVCAAGVGVGAVAFDVIGPDELNDIP